MSTFWGYIFEGIVFFVIWMWWLVNTFVQTIKCESNGKDYVPRLSFAIPGTKIPAETLFKILTSGLGFLATVFYDGVSLVDDERNYRKMATVISMSIYGIFLVHSIADLLLWYGIPLIPNTDYITAALGFFWYSLATFYRAGDFKHTAPVATMVKTFPLYPLFTTGVCLLVEAEQRRGYYTQMIRTVCLGVLATWNLNAAFILHKASRFPGAAPSDWNMAEHSNVAFIGAAFGDHICFHLIFLILFYAATAVFMRLRYGVRLPSHE